MLLALPDKRYVKLAERFNRCAHLGDAGQPYHQACRHLQACCAVSASGALHKSGLLEHKGLPASADSTAVRHLSAHGLFLPPRSMLKALPACGSTGASCPHPAACARGDCGRHPEPLGPIYSGKGCPGLYSVGCLEQARQPVAGSLL